MKFHTIALAVLGMALGPGTALGAADSPTGSPAQFTCQVTLTVTYPGDPSLAAPSRSYVVPGVASVLIRQFAAPSDPGLTADPSTCSLITFGGDTLPDGSSLAAALQNALLDNGTVSAEVDLAFPAPADPSAPIGSSVQLSGVTGVTSRARRPDDLDWSSLDDFATTRIEFTFTGSTVTPVFAQGGGKITPPHKGGGGLGL